MRRHSPHTQAAGTVRKMKRDERQDSVPLCSMFYRATRKPRVSCLAPSLARAASPQQQPSDSSSTAFGQTPGILLFVSVVQGLDFLLAFTLGQLGGVAGAVISRRHLQHAGAMSAPLAQRGSTHNGQSSRMHARAHEAHAGKHARTCAAHKRAVARTSTSHLGSIVMMFRIYSLVVVTSSL